MEDKTIRRYTVEVEGEFPSSEIQCAVHGRDMAIAISSFFEELKYRFKYREMSDLECKIYEEILEMARERFEKFEDLLE